MFYYYYLTYPFSSQYKLIFFNFLPKISRCGKYIVESDYLFLYEYQWCWLKNLLIVTFLGPIILFFTYKYKFYTKFFINNNFPAYSEINLDFFDFFNDIKFVKAQIMVYCLSPS